MGCLAPRFSKAQRKQSEAQEAAGARGQGCSLPQPRRTDPPGCRPGAAVSLRPPLTSASRRLPTPAGGGGRGRRGGAGVAEGAGSAPRATPPPCGWVAWAPRSRSPASFVRWAQLPGRRRRPARPRPSLRPSPGLRAAARPAAVRRSRRRRRPQGGIPGPSQGAKLSSPRLCFRPPWPARRVGPRAGTGGPALPPAPSRGSAAASGTHPQTLPAASLPVWTLPLMTPGGRLPWRGMVQTLW